MSTMVGSGMSPSQPGPTGKVTEVTSELIRMNECVDALEKGVHDLESRIESVLGCPTTPMSKPEELPSCSTALAGNLQTQNSRLQGLINALCDIRRRCEL